ncbi:phage recombination protein Bet [Muribacter muris]|uniref:Phage recombination protein Bet n=1 Tax=Muribacter muris TaxID=67855 RepID=A0A4Y9JPG6_9PAST|nr:phage recombination protein Bet [Muribacter muris]MBF0786169.1 phage recombination protein Bet [Muribacter muris]MBF0828300.1 phage recombination protein Bet [Muribacter muris]TFV07693.1 phage recombination protein Bet [Muribacter muris]
MTTALQTLTNKLAERFEMGSSDNLAQTLVATAFKGQTVTPEQMTALLVVANQYELNPWTNEIYAFPVKGGGIIPIVGVDGWYAIINKHPQFDGIEFEQNAESCTCRIFRKDRQRPTVVTEYLDECKRPTDPWNKYPKRMLRHKAAIQCARVAFSLSGIYEPDEADRINEGQTVGTPQNQPAPTKNAGTGDPSNAEFETLVSTLESIAQQGIEALEQCWKNLTKEQRFIVGSNELARIKELAKQYEQGTMQDAEFTEA